MWKASSSLSTKTHKGNQRTRNLPHQIIMYSPDPTRHLALLGKRFIVQGQTYSKMSLAIGIPKNSGDARASLAALYNNGLIKSELFEGEESINDVVYLMMVAMFNKSSRTAEDKTVQKHSAYSDHRSLQLTPHRQTSLH
jgi:hypothetical protein